MIPTELTDSILEWFQTLDYEFMVLHALVCYGLYYSNNFKWINQYFSPIQKKGRTRGVWLIGGILAVFEIARFLPFIPTYELMVQKIVSILHSYVLIQVFVEEIVNRLHKSVQFFKSKNIDRDSN